MLQFKIPVFLTVVEMMENNKRDREMRLSNSESDMFRKFDLEGIDKLKRRY